jgi:hypothetical protein
MVGECGDKMGEKSFTGIAAVATPTQLRYGFA